MLKLHRLKAKRVCRYRNPAAFNLTTARLMRCAQAAAVRDKLGLDK